VPLQRLAEKIVMLPHTRPEACGIAGNSGRPQRAADLHVLAAELSLEVDALLPTVDTRSSRLLKLVKATHLTPEGKRSRMRHSRRKTMFRKAVVARSPVAQMQQALKSKPTARCPRIFPGLLDEHFSEDEARRQLETPSNGPIRRAFRLRRGKRKLTLTET